METHLCNCAVIIIIFIKCIHGQVLEEDFCDNVRPEFSHAEGQPHVVPVLTNETNKYLDISWSTDKILSGKRCADAFEVEFQQVGGGRLTWSSWSAMVTCAPTRNDTINVYHCNKTLNWRNCATRIRFRIIPHNSRNMIIKVRASPYEEVVVYCYLGSPSRVEVNKLSSGLYNKPLSPMERASRIYVAQSRDIRLKKLQESMERTRENRRIKNERIKEQQRRNEERIKQQKERQKTTNAPPTSRVYTFTHHTTTSNPQSTAKTTRRQSFTYGLSEGTSTTARPFICEYSEWSSWSNCTEQCGSGTKSRQRDLLSRDPIECLFTNQTKSCFGNTCNQTSESSGERAVLLPGKYAERRMKKGYEVRSNLKNFTDDSYTPLYCAEFEVLSATRSCLKNAEFRSLRKGSVVCSLCMKKSEENKSICKGDGGEHKLLGFRLMLETRCFGTWKKIKQEQECSCQVDYSFLFA